MSKNENPSYLVKVVNRKWAEKLVDGEVFMRAIACFGDLSRRSEDSNNQFRGDSLEGFSQSFANHHNPFAFMEDSNNNISELVPTQVGLIDVLTYREKIFCLYILDYDETLENFVQPDPRVADFGDTAVIIHNPQEFLRRVCHSMLQRFGNDFWTSFMRVEYNIDFSSSQPYDEFCKSPSYSWQNEFRIALDLAQGRFDPKTLSEVTDLARITFPGEIVEDKDPDSLADAIVLDIGNISDICVLVPVDEFIACDNIQRYIPKCSFPPQPIVPLIVPRQPKPTFFKLVAQLP